MNHLKKYTDLVNETLKSDEIEIVCRKISDFFNKLGFNKKEGFFKEVESPYYQISSDRDFLRKSIDDYKNPSKFVVDYIKRHNKKKKNKDNQLSSQAFMDMYVKSLEEFKYGDIFIFADKNSPEITNKLLHLISSVGYFVATVSKYNANKIDMVTDPSKIESELSKDIRISISIEPRYDPTTFGDEYLYHTTDIKNLNKILKIGLSPKSKNTRSFYPGRIYLSPNIKYNDSIKDQLSTGDKKGEYVDLKIKNFPGLKLHKDVRMKGAFYTYTNIPPKYIDVIK